MSAPSRFHRIPFALLPTAACLTCFPPAMAAEPVAEPTEAVVAETEAPAKVTPSGSAKTLDTVRVSGKKQPYRNLSATGATKTDTLLKDLPQSVRVVTADALEDAGVTKLAEALDLGSGISKQSNLGGLWDSYAMRGFTGDPNFGSDYMVNGFNYSRGYNGVRDSANTNSVEILKGPASALYGRGEPGGTVNITTKKPLFQPEQVVDFSIGSFNTYRTTADLTGPLSEKLAYRLNAAYEQGDSYRDHVSSERYLMSPSFLWMLSDDTTVSYELEVSKQKATFDRGVVAVDGKLGLVPRSRFFGEPNDGLHTIDTIGNQIFVQHYFSDEWSVQGGLSYRESSIEGISTEARFLRADKRTLVRQRRTRDNEASDLSGRVELLGKLKTGGIAHNVLFGIDAYRFEDRRIQYRVANANTIDIYNPVYGQSSPPMTLNTSTKETQNAYGLYVQDQIDLTDKWKVLAGVRFDDYDQSLRNFRSNRTTEQSLTATSPRLGLVYQPNRLVSLYATTAKSFRPNSGVSRDFEPFPAETGRSYEIGAKVDSADNKVTGTLALYSITKQNVLTPDPIDPNNFSVAAGEVKSDGVELDVTGEVYPTVRLSAAYAYTDARVEKDNNSFLVGRQMANVPKHSANLMLAKSLLLQGHPASVGIAVNYVGEREGAVAPLIAADDFKLPSYTIVKLFSSYNIDKKTRLSFEINNLFDKEYYTSSYNQVWVFPGTERSFKATLQYRF